MTWILRHQLIFPARHFGSKAVDALLPDVIRCCNNITFENKLIGCSLQGGNGGLRNGCACFHFSSGPKLCWSLCSTSEAQALMHTAPWLTNTVTSEAAQSSWTCQAFNQWIFIAGGRLPSPAAAAPAARAAPSAAPAAKPPTAAAGGFTDLLGGLDSHPPAPAQSAVSTLPVCACLSST